MNKWVFALALMVAAAGVRAEKLSCDEVDQVGESLATIAVVMDDPSNEIGEGTEADQGLRDSVDGLAMIAEAEGDEDLAAAAAGMDSAWQAMDRDAFVDALTDAIAKLAVIHASECE
jgi:hypothetical protein